MDNSALSVGSTSVSGTALQSDFEMGDYMICYMTLFFDMGSMCQDEGNHINREDNKSGYTLFCFDWSSDLKEGGGYVNLKKIAHFHSK